LPPSWASALDRADILGYLETMAKAASSRPRKSAHCAECQDAAYEPPSPEALAALEAGIESAKTKPSVYRRESFAKYADDEWAKRYRGNSQLPKLAFSDTANRQLDELEQDRGQAARLKAVRSALGRMEVNLRHPGLNTHEFKGKACPHGGKLFEAYAQNHAPGAFRIFWCYAPEPDTIMIVAITAHP
jgi:hypothetical protein